MSADLKAVLATGLVCFAVIAACPGQGAESRRGEDVDIDALINWLIDHDEELREIPFSKVISATSGRKILPVNRADSQTAEFLGRVEKGIATALERLQSPSHTVHSAKRINEASAHFERELLAVLGNVEGFRCEFPKTAAGKTQRSGYPDLRLTDARTGRIAYLDPKLFASESRGSSLRTFYFTPKRATNKVLEDAHHILIGFPHDGRGPDGWRFVGWELIDLSHFSVRLKSEFQGSNRDIYTEEASVGSSSEARP